MAGWRSEHAQRIYATVDRAEREAAAQALVDFVKVAAAAVADKNK